MSVSVTSLCRPLKFESLATNGDVTDQIMTEASPTSDYLTAKGLTFEGTTDFALQKLGRVIINIEPDATAVPTYLANGELNYIEYFNSTSAVTANRTHRVDLGYDTNLSPTSENWTIYSTDGTTQLRTIVYSYTYSNADMTNVTMVTT